MPVISAQQLLTWLDGRNGSSFGGITWNGDDARLLDRRRSRRQRARGDGAGDVGSASADRHHAQRLAGRLPLETIKGVAYAIFSARAGALCGQLRHVTTTPPVITDVAATPSISDRPRSPGRRTKPPIRASTTDLAVGPDV